MNSKDNLRMSKRKRNTINLQKGQRNILQKILQSIKLNKKDFYLTRLVQMELNL